ncbi:hypothetical protein N308_14838, partial [Struthio camelus australis]
LTSDVGYGEAPVGRVAVRVEDQQQLVPAGYDGRQPLSPAPLAQQGGVFGASVERCQMVVVAAICQAAPSLQIQVQEEDFDSVPRGQLDGPLALEVIGVEVGILRTGEV